MFWKTLMMATPVRVFVFALLVVKLMVIVMLVAGVIAVVLAVVRRVNGGPKSGALNACAIVAVCCGVFASAYTALNTWIGWNFALDRPHHIDYIYPDIITVGYVLILAGLVVCIAAFGNAGARRA